jgi:hypothetical protein
MANHARRPLHTELQEVLHGWHEYAMVGQDCTEVGQVVNAQHKEDRS